LFDIDGNEFAGLVAGARAVILGIDALDDDAVVQRTKLHDVLLRYWDFVVFRWVAHEAKKLPCEARSF
jgi:hypothetical protein